MMALRIAIIGGGSIGLRHAQNLLRLGYRNLVMCEPRLERRRWLQRALRLDVASTLPEAFHPPVDVAFITSPTVLHVNHAEMALRFGAHLFIEKPLAHVLSSRVRRLLLHAKQQRRKIFVAVNMRWHPGVATIKRLLDRQAIGKILSARVEAGYWLPDWHPGQDYRRWYMAHRRLGGGALLDGIHEIDYLCWLLGDPVAVTAETKRVSNLKINTEDVAELILNFKNGAIGNVHVDYLQRAYQRTCRLIGSEGTIEWNFHKPEVRVYNAKRKKWKSPRFSFKDTNQMYVDELKFFFRALRGSVRDPLDGRDGLRALAVAEAARKSSQTGRRQKVDW